ncbi:MAG: Lrp/AsnC family transcriptional regulator [Verrucomicrobiota bacterium]|nr:Lrp/AsnC family transcriptional regulator [Verrucomicrobiota bacterium]
MDELLKILKENALESPRDLARMLGLPEDEVKQRITDYEAKGMIRAYQAILNPNQLDPNSVQAVIEVKITPKREGGFDRIASRISKFPEVESLFLMSGTYDLLVFLAGHNLREAAHFVSEKLATIEGVLSTSTHFMLKTYKDHGVLMEDKAGDERLPVSP